MLTHCFAQLESVTEAVVVALSGGIFQVAAAGAVTAFAVIWVEVVTCSGIAPHAHELPRCLTAASPQDHR